MYRSGSHKPVCCGGWVRECRTPHVHCASSSCHDPLSPRNGASAGAVQQCVERHAPRVSLFDKELEIFGCIADFGMIGIRGNIPTPRSFDNSSAAPSKRHRCLGTGNTTSSLLEVSDCETFLKLQNIKLMMDRGNERLRGCKSPCCCRPVSQYSSS